MAMFFHHLILLNMIYQEDPEALSMYFCTQGHVFVGQRCKVIVTDQQDFCRSATNDDGDADKGFENNNQGSRFWEKDDLLDLLRRAM